MASSGRVRRRTPALTLSRPYRARPHGVYLADHLTAPTGQGSMGEKEITAGLQPDRTTSVTTYLRTMLHRAPYKLGLDAVEVVQFPTDLVNNNSFVASRETVLCWPAAPQLSKVLPGRACCCRSFSEGRAKSLAQGSLTGKLGSCMRSSGWSSSAGGRIGCSTWRGA